MSHGLSTSQLAERLEMLAADQRPGAYLVFVTEDRTGHHTCFVTTPQDIEADVREWCCYDEDDDESEVDGEYTVELEIYKG